MYKIIAIMGKAGSGKDSLMQQILSMCPMFHEIVSCTTRPMRQGEQNGVNYHFYTMEQFLDRAYRGEMLECTTFNNWIYGTSFDSVSSERINIGVFNPAGVSALLDNPSVDVQIIYVKASDKIRLLRQLNREEDPDVGEIIRRYGADEKDFTDAEYFFDNCLIVSNEDGVNLKNLAEHTIAAIEPWVTQGR